MRARAVSWVVISSGPSVLEDFTLDLLYEQAFNTTSAMMKALVTYICCSATPSSSYPIFSFQVIT